MDLQFYLTRDQLIDMKDDEWEVKTLFMELCLMVRILLLQVFIQWEVSWF